MQRSRALLFGFLGLSLLVFLAASVGAHRSRPQGLIASDGKGYYAWLRSVALDGDLDFRNDYRLIYPPDPLPDTLALTPRGLVRNKYPVGVALTELPGFLAGHAIAGGVGAPRDGVSTPYQFAITFWLQLLCLAGLAALWLAAVRLGADPALAAIVVASALAATNLVQYAARPAMAHAPGLAVLSFAIYFASAASSPAGRLRHLVGVGLLLGLATIIRPSNVALAPLFAVLLWKPLSVSSRRWLLFAGSFAAVIALQVALVSLLWGGVRFSGYTNEGFTSGMSGVVNSLVSPRHGLFIYHPWYLGMLLVTVMGTVRRETRALALAALASFLGLAIINGTWWSWWFGDSFGNRAYIEIIPALVVPAALRLSAAVTRRHRMIGIVTALAVVLSVANAHLWAGFVLRRYPPDGLHSVSQAYLWPWQQRP